jgi:LPXTG-site transpeptidase (sortase) family protein
LVQDTAVIQTPVSVPLGIQIIGSDPAIWRVESPVTITYRIYNASTATTVTNIIHSISNPTPCEDIQYFDAAVGGNPVTFNGTLAPLAEVFVTCTHDPVEAQPTGQITVRAGAEGTAEGSPVVATAEQIFDVVELGLTVQLTGAPDNGARTSVVDEGERINFTLLLQNSGQTDLILPPASEDPVTSRVYDANNPTSVLGTLGNLYTYLENECIWPLAPTDTCQIAFNDTFVTPPDLTFTPLAIHPSLMQTTVEVMLWDALNNVPIMQTSTWDIEVQRPSIIITSLTVNPNTPMQGTEVILSAIIQNDGFSTLENVSAVVNLNEIVAYIPQSDGIVLTSGHGQTSILNSVPMDVVDTVLVPGEQTTATIAWEVDRVGQFQVQVITRADNTVAGASLTTVQDNMETTFNSIADPSIATTDPDGNPLDPDALDPTIVKTAEPAAAFPNQDITFTITITNGSTANMGNISFVDAVPDAFTVVSASTTRGASIVSGQLITASTGQLAPGERVTLTIVTTVAPDVSIPSLWTNEACANVEGRDPVCASVEVGVGTDAAILPTTGFGEPPVQHNESQKQLPVPEEASEEPVTQGIPGAAGVIPLLGMGLFMLSTSQTNRQRWVISGAAVAIVGTMALGLLVLSGDDDDEGDDGSADVPTLTPTFFPTGQSTATLQRRATAVATVTLPPFDTPQAPENLPFPPTIRPSPTPYILPTASGPRRLEIPKLNLTRPVPIVELPQEDDTWDVSELGHNVGWLEHTTWLDPTWGNTVIVGHVQLDSDDPGPFYHLGSLVVGDEIIIWEGNDRFVYEVAAIETVHSTAIEVTHPTHDPILTLLTCTNWDFDRGVFADRLIIRAVPIERPTG